MRGTKLDFGNVKSQLEQVLIGLFRVMADMLFVLIWVVGEYFFEYFLVPRIPVQSEVAKIAMWIFRGLFAVSTLMPAVSFVIKDIHLMILRLRIRRRAPRAELELTDIKQELLMNDRSSVVVYVLIAGFQIILFIGIYALHESRIVFLSLTGLVIVVYALLRMAAKRQATLRGREMIMSLPDVMDAQQVGQLVDNLLEGITGGPSKH